MKLRKNLPLGELIFLLAILCFIIYYFISIKEYGSRAVLWPYILMVTTILVSIPVIIEIFKEANHKNSQSRTEKIEGKSIVQENISTVVVIYSFLAYILSLKKLGMNLCNFCLSFFLVFFLSKGRWKTALIMASATTLFFYLVFAVALGIRFPKFRLF